jgi:8-oxo-dGTP pyrophosphatase MutT (NUDIX family)
MDGSTVFVFDKKRERILLVKRRDIPIWVIPGGGIEKGETPEKAAVREVKEESGFDVKIIRKVAEYTHKGSGKRNNLFEAVVTGGEAGINNEASAIDFFYPDKMPEPRHPLINEWLVDLNKKSKKIIKREIQGVTIKQALRQIHKYPIVVIRFMLTRFGIRINT